MISISVIKRLKNKTLRIHKVKFFKKSWGITGLVETWDHLLDSPYFTDEETRDQQVKCFVQGPVLRPNPKPAGFSLVQFPLPQKDCLRNTDTRKTEDVFPWRKKKHIGEHRTHVEVLKKDSSKVKGKLRRGYHILVHEPRTPNSGHESLSALARQEPWSVRWTCSSLWPDACWQWSCTVLFELLPDLSAAAAGTGAKSEHSRVLGTSQSGCKTAASIHVEWPGLTCLSPGLANQPLWILRAFTYDPINCLSVSSIRAPLQITEEVLDGRWPKFPASSLILPSSKETW